MHASSTNINAKIPGSTESDKPINQAPVNGYETFTGVFLWAYRSNL